MTETPILNLGINDLEKEPLPRVSFSIAIDSTPQVDFAVEDKSNQFLLGVKRGTYEQLGVGLGSGINILSNTPGLGFLKSIGEDLETGARAQLDTLPLPNEADVTALWQRLQSGEAGPDEALDWFAYNLGNAGPSMAASVGAGVVGTAIAGPPGGIAGMAGVSWLLNAGEVYANLREQGYDSPGAAAAAGIPMAFLDVVTPGRILGKTVWQPSKLLRGTGARGLAQSLRRVGREALTSCGSEAITEAAQEAIGAGVETGVTGKDFFTPETMSRVLNAFAAGGLAGGVFGAGGQGYLETQAGRVERARPLPGYEPIELPDVSIEPLNRGPKIVEEQSLLGQDDSSQRFVDTREFEPSEIAPRVPTYDPVDLKVPEEDFLLRQQDIALLEQVEQQRVAEEQKIERVAQTPTLEELMTDPDSPVFRTPRGATALQPTDDIFVVADKVDLSARALEFRSLGYFPATLDVEGTDYAGEELGGSIGGSYAHKGQAWREDRIGKSRPRDLETGAPGREFFAERSKLSINSRFVMTPVQLDSIQLHEMIHQELDERADAVEKEGNTEHATFLRKQNDQHGILFQERAKEVSQKAGIPVTTTHNVPMIGGEGRIINAFQTQTIRGAQKAIKGTAQTLANKITDTLITYWPGSLKPTNVPGKAAVSATVVSAAYRARLMMEELRRRGLQPTAIRQLIRRHLDSKKYKGLLVESEKERVTQRILQGVADIERQASRAHPVVLLYTRAPDATAMLHVAEQTAPDGTTILLT